MNWSKEKEAWERRQAKARDDGEETGRKLWTQPHTFTLSLQRGWIQGFLLSVSPAPFCRSVLPHSHTDLNITLFSWFSPSRTFCHDLSLHPHFANLVLYPFHHIYSLSLSLPSLVHFFFPSSVTTSYSSYAVLSFLTAPSINHSTFWSLYSSHIWYNSPLPISPGLVSFSFRCKLLHLWLKCSACLSAWMSPFPMQRCN